MTKDSASRQAPKAHQAHRHPRSPARARRALGITGCGLTLAVSVAACEDAPPDTAGTDVGNGRASLSFDVTGFASDASSKSLVLGDDEAAAKSLSLTGGVTIDHFYVALERVRFRPGAVCDGPDETEQVDLAGPVVADLADGGLIGGPVVLDLPAGQFCEMRLRFRPLDADELPDGAPVELAGSSIFVQGTRADGVAFEVRSDDGDEFRLEAVGGAFALPTGADAAFLAYDVAGWIGALDLEGAAGPGPILIDDDNDSDRLDAFEDAIDDSSRLFRDADQDGALSTTETGAALAEGAASE